MEKNNTEKTQDMAILPLNKSAVSSIEKYSIIQTGGKQYFAVEGKTIAVEKINGDVGSEVIFDKVLFRRMDSNACEVGTPYLKIATKATIVKHTKGDKIIVFKFKRRKKSRTKKGHRQLFTIVRITSL